MNSRLIIQSTYYCLPTHQTLKCFLNEKLHRTSDEFLRC